MHDPQELICDAHKIEDRLKLLELHDIVDDQPLQRENEDGKVEFFKDCQESYQNQLRYIREDLHRLKEAMERRPWTAEESARLLYNTIQAAGEYCDSWGH